MPAQAEIRFANGLQRVILLGARPLLPEIAAFLLQNGVEVESYVAPRQADIPASDGRPLADALAALGVPVMVTAELRDHSRGPYHTADDRTLILSFAMPYPVDQELFALYGGRLLNVHGAALPENRGGGGLSWSIMAGETQGAVTIHVLQPEGAGPLGLLSDSGAVAARLDFRFPDGLADPASFEAAVDKAAIPFICGVLTRLRDGHALVPAQQDEELSAFFPRLSTACQGYIDWSWEGAEIERFVRAFSHPYSGAATFSCGRRVRILSARFQSWDRCGHPFLHGLVVRIHQGLAHIACRGGRLVVSETDMLAAPPVLAGERLHTPRTVLDEALSYFPVYTPQGLKTS